LVRDKRSEIRDQISEVINQRSDIKEQMPADSRLSLGILILFNRAIDIISSFGLAYGIGFLTSEIRG